MATDKLKTIAEAKANDRIERAQRPFEEKIQALVRIQKRNAKIAATRGKKSRAWDVSF